MPIPAFDGDGFLPVGVHDCTLEEIRDRFGAFQKSDRRPQLFAKLETFVAEAVKTGRVINLLVDGSFVTAKAEPNDVDLIPVVAPDHDSGADLPPLGYNVLSIDRVNP